MGLGLVRFEVAGVTSLVGRGRILAARVNPKPLTLALGFGIGKVRLSHETLRPSPEVVVWEGSIKGLYKGLQTVFLLLSFYLIGVPCVGLPIKVPLSVQYAPGALKTNRDVMVVA